MLLITHPYDASGAPKDRDLSIEVLKMEDERILSLMMDALDGVLDERGQTELTASLVERPDLAAEWEALRAVDSLLLASPPAAAPIHLIETTLARLPNPRNRRIFAAAFSLFLFICGLIPVVLVWTLASSGAGGLFSGFLPTLSQSFQIMNVILTGMISSSQELIQTQPYIYSWLALMVTVILAWWSVYRNMLTPIQPSPVAVS